MKEGTPNTGSVLNNGWQLTMIAGVVVVLVCIVAWLISGVVSPGKPVLTVNSKPPGARVFVDEVDVGKTPVEIGELSIGNHTVQVVLEKHHTFSEKIVIQKNTSVNIVAILTPVVNGMLSVDSTPSGAGVYIDDIKVGKTPFRSDQLADGKHKITLELDDYQVWEKEINLKAGGEIIVAATMKPVIYIWNEPVTGMKFVKVEGGCCQMGNSYGDGDADEGPVHEICVDGFYMGQYEVTQGEYQKIMGQNPSKYKNGSKYPVERVSWVDVQVFLQQLNKRSEKTFRLPTEAEWEYAASGYGNKNKFSTSTGELTRMLVNYGKDKCCSGDESDGFLKTAPVGSYPANNFGFHDLSGNVWEWCSDWYDQGYYQDSPRQNPKGPELGNHRVIRGGSWLSSSKLVRVVSRSRREPVVKDRNTGFRLVFTQSSEKQAGKEADRGK